MSVNHLSQLFGEKQSIGEIVQNFDFSKIDVRDNTKEDFLTVKLAPSFGENLTRDAIRAMDEELKVMILATTKELQKLPSEQRDWGRICAIMDQNPLIEPDPTFPTISRSDKLGKSSSGIRAFEVDCSPDSEIVREVNTWFTTLINDPDVLQATSINFDVLAKVVAQTGAKLDSFETFFTRDEEQRKCLIDISVLRFPDLDHPYFKLYRIQLEAWAKSERIVFVQQDSHGITGHFNCKRFKPRAYTMANLSPMITVKAATEAENMLEEYLNL